MQIDLLATPRGEIGLVANRNFDSDVSGVIFDVLERSLTLEFGASMDSLKLNVPVGDEFVDTLKHMSYLHVCAVERGRMMYAKQAPLMKVSVEDDDFIYGEMKRGIMHVQTWMRDAKFAQPVHRDNLGDEGSSGGVMRGLSRETLQVAPQLAQQLVNEKALVQKQQLQNAPRMVPPSLGPGSQPNMGPGPRPPHMPSSDDNGDN